MLKLNIEMRNNYCLIGCGEILKNTLTAIESGKEEIFFIVETSRTETHRLINELSQLKTDISKVISQVDNQEKLIGVCAKNLWK